MENLKNTLSNIVAVVVAVGTIVATALDSVPEDAEWYVWVGALAIALISYFTGKTNDLKAK